VGEGPKYKNNILDHSLECSATGSEPCLKLVVLTSKNLPYIFDVGPSPLHPLTLCLFQPFPFAVVRLCIIGMQIEGKNRERCSTRLVYTLCMNDNLLLFPLTYTHTHTHTHARTHAHTHTHTPFPPHKHTEMKMQNSHLRSRVPMPHSREHKTRVSLPLPVKTQTRALTQTNRHTACQDVLLMFLS